MFCESGSHRVALMDTHHVDQTGLELESSTHLCLRSADMKGMYCLAWPFRFKTNVLKKQLKDYIGERRNSGTYQHINKNQINLLKRNVHIYKILESNQDKQRRMALLPCEGEQGRAPPGQSVTPPPVRRAD